MTKVITLQDLEAEITDNIYIDRDILHWAMDQIEQNNPEKYRILALLHKKWNNTSPMWRQSHRYLEKFFERYDV